MIASGARLSRPAAGAVGPSAIAPASTWRSTEAAREAGLGLSSDTSSIPTAASRIGAWALGGSNEVTAMRACRLAVAGVTPLHAHPSTGATSTSNESGVRSNWARSTGRSALSRSTATRSLHRCHSRSGVGHPPGSEEKRRRSGESCPRKAPALARPRCRGCEAGPSAPSGRRQCRNPEAAHLGTFRRRRETERVIREWLVDVDLLL